METKWYKSNVLYILLSVFVIVFNFIVMFFAAGYIDALWEINELTSKVLGLVFVGLFTLNAVMLFRNYR